MSVWSKEQKIAFAEAHPLIMPRQQPRHNYPHADVKTYFDTIFASDHEEYKGMVIIAAIKEGETTPKLVGAVPAAKLGDWASKMYISTHMDYYYGKAQHTGHSTWGTEGAFAYNALYVDIDAHGTAVTPTKNLLENLLYALPDTGVPVPNIVETSGRGYHLVWLIEQVSAQLERLVKAVSEHFSNTVKDLLYVIGSVGCQVDTGYSSNVAGLTRIPGTYNTAAGAYAEYRLLNSDRLDVPKAYDSIPARKGYRSTRPTTYTANIGEKRVDALIKLSNIRHIQVGQRDLYCLHLFSAAQMAGMSNEAALECVQLVNATFDTPLSQKEVKRCLSTAARKHYKYSNARIIADLDITVDEQNDIGLHSGKMNRDTNKARNDRVAARRRNRNRAIMHLHLLGLSPSAIAKQVGNAYNTVRKVITQYAGNLTELFSQFELMRIAKEKVQALVDSIHVKQPNVAFFKNRSANYAYTDAEPVVSPAASPLPCPNNSAASPRSRAGHERGCGYRCRGSQCGTLRYRGGCSHHP
jgi:hypothetical protein